VLTSQPWLSLFLYLNSIWWWSCRWGETSQYCGQQWAYCSSPRGWYVSVESHGGDASWGKLLTHPPELSGNPTSRAIWEQVGRMDEVRILPIRYLKYLKESLICLKILWHGASGFTSHQKEGVLLIFIALKIHRLSRDWACEPRVQ
jgi:hypothetical protein